MRNAAFAAFLASFAVLFSGLALAQENSTMEPGIDFTRIKNYELPDFAGRIIGDARVNIYDYESRLLGSMLIRNGTVVEAGAGPISDETHKFYIKDLQTAKSVFESESFVKEFNRQRSLQNIRLEAHGILNSIKLAIVTLVVSIISIFIVPQ